MRSLLILIVIIMPSLSFAQGKKLELDDLMIKGEIHSDNRMLLLSRQKNELKNIVRFPKNYREEILQECRLG
ncbi:MAG: hypothetical protein LW875_00070 [Proteobacteria bacterium]|jgi:hypothetical protein|nr:hypothetical protein [Pseudomonadota bacterium]